MPRKGKKKKKRPTRHNRANVGSKKHNNSHHRDYLHDAEDFGDNVLGASGRQQPGDLKYSKPALVGVNNNASSSAAAADGLWWDDPNAGEGGSGGGGGGGNAAAAPTRPPNPADFPNLNPSQQLAAVTYLEESNESDIRQEMEVLALKYMFMEDFQELPRKKYRWIYHLRHLRVMVFPDSVDRHFVCAALECVWPQGYPTEPGALPMVEVLNVTPAMMTTAEEEEEAALDEAVSYTHLTLPTIYSV